MNETARLFLLTGYGVAIRDAESKLKDLDACLLAKVSPGSVAYFKRQHAETLEALTQLRSARTKLVTA